MNLQESTDKQNIIKWYDKYSSSIFRYILKMTRDPYKAEDLTQDTFIKAFEYISSNNMPVNYPKTFLYQIAHNITIDYFRKSKPIYMFREFFKRQKSNDLSVESIVMINEESVEVYEALQQLKLSYRQVIILRRIEGFSIKETAEILNWSESKVKSTLYRALKRLERDLTKGGLLNELS